MTDKDAAAKAVIRDWVKMQEQKYGPNWKEIVSKEMAEKATPTVKALLGLLQRKKGEL